MAHADGIAAHGLEFPQTAFEHAVRHGGANGPRIAMQAHAEHFHLFPVQEKSPVDVVVNAAHAKRGVVVINDLAGDFDLGVQLIKVG